MKVKQRQLQNNNSTNNNLSKFNSITKQLPMVVYYEKLLIDPYKKLGYVFYIFCIRFVYVFKKSTVFIRNWSIFCINYMFLILHFL